MPSIAYKTLLAISAVFFCGVAIFHVYGYFIQAMSYSLTNYGIRFSFLSVLVSYAGMAITCSLMFKNYKNSYFEFNFGLFLILSLLFFLSLPFNDNLLHMLSHHIADMCGSFGVLISHTALLSALNIAFFCLRFLTRLFQVRHLTRR